MATTLAGGGHAVADREQVRDEREPDRDVEVAAARSAHGQSLGDIQLAYGVAAPVQRKVRDGRADDLETMMLHGPEAPVQAKGAGGVRAAAGRGIADGATALPHADQIQRSFGSYDVSGVQAHVGGQATEACDDMNAEAYATGNHVAFRSTPDLHTAAHEAAHVVQQRAGVHFAGGVGRQGDVYEQHADAVADQVVAGGSAENLLSEMAPAEDAGAGEEAVQMRGKLGSGEEAFEAMWEAHPHNYQEDASQNEESEDVREEHGLPDYMQNTCAIRLSIMLNETGNRITPAKCAAAGLARRPHYSRKTRSYYILAAREMWQYLERHFREEDVMFPARGRYKDEEEFQAAFESTIKPLIQSRKGIVAFEKVFSYGGTGHIDLFDGETLSDAAGWYACQRLRLWFVVVS
jgi:hypothetical protein